MRKNRRMYQLLALLAFVFVALVPARAQQKAPATTTPVQMTVTVNVLGENKRMPEIAPEDVIVHQGKERLQVTRWVPVRADRAGLDVFILIDDAGQTSVASQFDDLRSFINAQPPNTAVGVGYMRNGTVQVAQDFTTNHEQAAKALRIPIASSGAYGSPYLSAIDLMKRWPADSNRRELVMITDGIDRFRGGHYWGFGATNPDVDSASRTAQRTGTVVNTIFTRGVGRLGNNYWEIINGQMGLAKLSEQTGGQSYYVGTQNAVSFKPYLDNLQNTFGNKYVLEFHPVAGQKSGLRPVTLTTEVAGVEFASADNVWVNAK